jgi:hypothetical protein
VRTSVGVLQAVLIASVAAAVGLALAAA